MDVKDHLVPYSLPRAGFLYQEHMGLLIKSIISYSHVLFPYLRAAVAGLTFTEHAIGPRESLSRQRSSSAKAKTFLSIAYWLGSSQGCPSGLERTGHKKTVHCSESLALGIMKSPLVHQNYSFLKSCIIFFWGDLPHRKLGLGGAELEERQQ